jgi:hypothetical protein
MAQPSRHVELARVESCPYPYYTKLKTNDRTIYRRNNAIETIALPGAKHLRPIEKRLKPVSQACSDKTSMTPLADF